MNSHPKAKEAAVWLAAGLSMCIVLILAVIAPPQVVLSVALIVLSIISGSRKNALLLVGILVPVLGFVRRLLAGDEGRVDFDPLVATPILIVIAIVLFGLMSDKRDSASRLAKIVGAIGVLFSLFVVISVILNRAFGFESLYFAALIVTPLLLIAGVLGQRVPDVWPSFERVIPTIAIIIALYGILQFFVLPSWDKNWMIASDLASIGHPRPFEVRIFGMSESPGPYALFLGLSIVFCLSRAADRERAAGLPWYLLGLFLLFPLLLSGVRSALVGVMVCAAVVVILRGRGMGRIFPLVLIAITAWLAEKVIASFDGVSTILNAKRYTEFEVSSDGSVQARLGLFEYLLNPLPHVIGNPSSGELDNLLVDTLVNYGIAPMILMALLMSLALVISLKILKRRLPGSAGLCTVFVFIAGFTSNFFISTFGIVAAMVLGSMFLQFLKNSKKNTLVQTTGPRIRHVIQAQRPSAPRSRPEIWKR